MGKPRSVSVKDGRDNISLADAMDARFMTVRSNNLSQWITWKKSWHHISERHPGSEKISGLFNPNVIKNLFNSMLFLLIFHQFCTRILERKRRIPKKPKERT
jgi:hypothetical protein